MLAPLEKLCIKQLTAKRSKVFVIQLVAWLYHEPQ